MTAALTEHGSETRRRIVLVATALMTEFGVEGITIRDVLAEARVSASQVYHYFHSKGGLIAAVLDEQVDGGGNRPQPLDSFAALREWCDLLVRTVEDHGGRRDWGLVVMTSSGESPSEHLRPRWMAALDWWEEPLRDGLRTMRDRGVLPEDADTDAFADALLAALYGGIALGRFRDSSIPLQAVLDAVLAHIEHAARTPTPSHRFVRVDPVRRGGRPTSRPFPDYAVSAG